MHDVITCHQRGYGYIHICTQYLIKWTWQTLKDGEDLNWTTMLIFHVRTLAFCHISSHSVHQYENLKTKTYQQINKTIPNIFPAMFQTNTRTGPHLLCATCWSHTWWGSYIWVQLDSVCGIFKWGVQMQKSDCSWLITRTSHYWFCLMNDSVTTCWSLGNMLVVQTTFICSARNGASASFTPLTLSLSHSHSQQQCVMVYGQ